MGGGKGADGTGKTRRIVDRTYLQMRQFRPARTQMHMAFDKTRQHACPAAVDDVGGGVGQRLDHRAFAQRQHPPPAQRDGLCRGPVRVHGQNTGIG